MSADVRRQNRRVGLILLAVFPVLSLMSVAIVTLRKHAYPYYACVAGTRPRGLSRHPFSDSPPDCAVRGWTVA